MTIPIDTLMRVALRNVATTACLLGFILATTYGGIGHERQDWKAPKSLKDIKHSRLSKPSHYPESTCLPATS